MSDFQGGGGEAAIEYLVYNQTNKQTAPVTVTVTINKM